LILLAFLLPFSVYLLVLGLVNRRPYPILVAGIWDFVGILFAASGFLLVVGPAVITSGSESWRMFWVFGTREGVPSINEEGTRLWGYLAAAYFTAVVTGAACLLYRRRGQTSVYNVESAAFERALGRSLDALGLNPVRTGDLLVFGAGASAVAGESKLPAGTAPDDSVGVTALKAAPGPATAVNELVDEPALLEVDAFEALRHVTLHWEPAASPLRRAVERDLARTLAQTPSTDHQVGDWILLVALSLIAFNLVATFGLTMSNFLRR
jgi:hypothetical protein